MGKAKFSWRAVGGSARLKGGWREMRVLAGFSTAMAIALILARGLHLPLEGLGSISVEMISKNGCNCPGAPQVHNLELKREKQEQARQTLSDPNLRSSTIFSTVQSSTDKASNTSAGGKQQDPPTPKLQPQIWREWEAAPALNDREWEKMHDMSYGEPRRFIPMGTAYFLFVQFGAYRGGLNSFAVVGLGPKALHLHGNPAFECSWRSGDPSRQEKINGSAHKYLPDWGFGKQYTVVVVNCSFPTDVGSNGSGGQLDMVATLGTWDNTGLEGVHFTALREQAGDFNDPSIFHAPFKYEYLYCGSPLYGNISPQRVREWIAYHAMLLGPKSHFMLYDAGGVHEDVRKILDPWIKLGRVTVQNIRQQTRYDTYYYNQFLVLNDCLMRSKSLANWTFFFDIDEYLHVPWYSTFDSVMSELMNLGRKAQQVVFSQRPMSHSHCALDSTSTPNPNVSSLWTMEKLLFRRTQITEAVGTMDKKFAIQPKYALATGVHRAEDVMYPEKGAKLIDTIVYEDLRIHYFHYHKTINARHEVCQAFLDPSLHSVTTILNVTHAFDDTMVSMGPRARAFELQTIGPMPTVL